MVYLIVLIGIIAALYAAVGHGGASGYLALMSIVGYEQAAIKPTALLLNLVVSFIAFVHFYRNGYFHRSLTFPFIVGSIPAAFLGGRFNIDPYLFKLILGVVLIISVFRMVVKLPETGYNNETNVYLALTLGAVIGLLSGLIGIGGGILLSPLLLLFKWSDAKTAACTSALFIWFNSLAGLFGFYSIGGVIHFELVPLLVSATIGALVGGYFGSYMWGKVQVKYALSFVLFLAAIKLIMF